jgi:hypothetical protein
MRRTGNLRHLPDPGNPVGGTGGGAGGTARARRSSRAWRSPPKRASGSPSPGPICAFPPASSCSATRRLRNPCTDRRRPRIGVIEGSAHEAMLRDYFPMARPVTYSRQSWMMRDLREGRSTRCSATGCGCPSGWRIGGGELLPLRGRALSVAEYLGLGLAIATREDDEALASAFDYALARDQRERPFRRTLSAPLPDRLLLTTDQALRWRMLAARSMALTTGRSSSKRSFTMSSMRCSSGFKERSATATSTASA